MSDSPVEIDFDHPYGVASPQREAALLRGLLALTSWHEEHCPPYRRSLDAIFSGRGTCRSLEELPFVPVSLFKHSLLSSVPESAITRTLTSSGTSGQQLSQVVLDARTAQLQVRALAAIVQDFIGRHRRPFVNIDQDPRAASTATRTARAAGVLGFSTFGRDHLHLLDGNMQPKWDELAGYLRAHQGEPLLLFGFTSIVWQHFLLAARDAGARLDVGPDSLLIHGGGWKKLADRQVSGEDFKRALREQFGIRHVSNYYGMVEQVGSIFMECEHGHLHAPAFAGVLIRDPITLQPAETGLIQVLSLLPHSYPGHSVLTEDLGTIVGVDNCACGRLGQHFLVHGRLAAAELRGCSDVPR